MDIRRHALLSAGILAAAAALGAGQPASSTDGSPSWGVRTASFDTLEGRVTVYLPDDIEAGDTLSGTVEVERRAPDRTEKKGAVSQLAGAVVELGGVEVPVTQRTFRWHAPATEAGGSVAVTLRDGKGAELGSTAVPVAPASTAPPPGIRLPGVCQAGRPLAIAGAFDGDLATSRVVIGGRAATPLAESPRRLVVRVPTELVGPSTIEAREGDATAAGTVRVVALGLSAPRVDLKRGETTPLSVQVSGLDGLDADLPLRVVNRSPETVSLAGGDERTVVISPGEVDPHGRFTWEGRLTGVHRGPFQIMAYLPSVAAPAPPPAAQAAPSTGCGCDRVHLTEKTSPWNHEIHAAEWKGARDGGTDRALGVTLTLKRSFTHRLSCAAGNGTCAATVTWTVTGTGVTLAGVRIGRDAPVELSTSASEADRRLTVSPRAVGYGTGGRIDPTVTLTAPCGGASERPQGVSYSIDVLLPASILRRLDNGEPVVFSAVEVTGTWAAAAAGCAATETAYEEPNGTPYRRRDTKPDFTGWKAK